MSITRRNLLRIGALGTMGFAMNRAQAQPAKPAETASPVASPHGWLNQRQRIYWYDQYALNDQETAFANYDPDRIAAMLEDY